jgi:uncharacterized protein YndB with AHSA1/START domain
MSAGTVRLHRVLRTTPERLYRAFIEPDALAKWLAPNGFTCKVHHVDANLGWQESLAALAKLVEPEIA